MAIAVRDQGRKNMGAETSKGLRAHVEKLWEAVAEIAR